MSTAGTLLRRAAARLPDRYLGTTAAAYRRLSPAFWRDVRRWRAFIAESEAWSEERLRDYQATRLRDVVQAAAAHVPYYRELFRRLSFEPENLREPEDLRQLPLLAKRDVQEHGEALVAGNVPPSERYYYSTAGSSGTPVGFWHDLDQRARERAFMSAQWARVGYREGDPTAVVRGAVVSQGLWEKDPANAWLLMSSYQLTEERLPAYMARLRRLRPKYLQAYPSNATILARFMLAHGEAPPPGLAAVLCGSENLYPWQRDLIREAFGCRVYSWYGQSECVALAGECEHSELLHVFPQYGWVELVDERAETVDEAGVPGEIVATGLHNHAMPLLRYRTGDVGVLHDGTCDRCRRPYRLLARIEGRLQEFVLTSTGRRISMTAINMHSQVFDNVYQFRFVQERPDELLLRLVPKPSYAADVDGPLIQRELEEKLGDDISLRLELVDELPRGGRGKYGFLDQMLDVKV